MWGEMGIWEEMKIWGNGDVEEWERGREWKKGEGMGMWEEWAKAGIDKGADNKIKQTPHSRESGNLPVSEAGRATLAPHRFVICADGAGIGKFPLSREWGILFLLSAPFSIPARPFTFSPLFPVPTTPIPPTLPIPAKAGISLWLRRGGLRARRFALSFAPMARE